MYWRDKQLGMVAEENTEETLLLEKAKRYDYNLKHKLSRVKKNNDGSEEVEHITIEDWLIEENADCLIMQSQLAFILGEGKVWEMIEKKIDRLRERIYVIDHSMKEITCLKCGKSFLLNGPIYDELECEHCIAYIFDSGFSWKLICPCAEQDYYVCERCKGDKYDKPFFDICPHNISEEGVKE